VAGTDLFEDSPADAKQYQRDEMRAKFMQIKQEMAEENESKSPAKPEGRKSLALDSILSQKTPKESTGFFVDKSQKSQWSRVRRMLRKSMDNSPVQSARKYSIAQHEKTKSPALREQDVFDDEGYLDIEYPPEER